MMAAMRVPSVKFSARASLVVWRRRLVTRERLLEAARRRHDGTLILRRKEQVAEALGVIRVRERQLNPLRVRAWKQAGRLLGIMEVGGNNSGAEVAAIIREGGGVAGGRPAWCGYFVATCYRRAGSRMVDWHWAAVRLMAQAGLLTTRSPLRGDIVRYTFDHTGLFGGWCDANGKAQPKALATHIRAREGNTGASGAVSDSRTGGDGVYEKIRPRGLVADFLRVPR